MSDCPSQARVVIIGGGVVGVSALYHLVKAGWSDCVLLEKNELTAGSTWHAAGNVPTFSTSFAVMNMQRYSTELYSRLGDEVDYPMNYHVTGSIRLAHSQARLQEFQRARNMGLHQGMDLKIMAVDELKDLYPFLSTHDLVGALYDSADGDIDPSQLVQALARGARAGGARIIRHCPATGVRRENGEWIVETEQGEIRCEIVVNAAGYYAQRVGEWFKPYGGRTVPMMVMSHQYLVFEEVDAVKAWSTEAGHKLPLLRDVDVSYYLRQEKNGFNLGPYEPQCKAHWVRPDDPMPEDFSFQLYPDDLDRIEPIVTDAMARVPVLAEAELGRVINGPIPYAPDGNPLLGPMPGVPNAFEACVFTFGIAQGGGAGKVLAEWIIEGRTEWDMWACDPRRFTDYTHHDYCVAKGMEVYGHEYAMHHPWHRWPAAPDQKVSPVHEKVRELGGVMGVYNGWERANWFAQPGDDTSEAATLTFNREGPWTQRVKEECEAVRDDVAVLDLPGFSRYSLQGHGAADWLHSLITGSLPKVGRMNLAYLADDRGRVRSEMTLLRWADDQFTLITAAAAQWHDLEYLKAQLPEGLRLEDQTRDIDTLIVTGPRSRELISSISDADLSLPWLSIQQAQVAGKSAQVVRVSFAGELGWEIHAANADMPAVYEAVLAQGAKPFGMWALDALRLEKGYRAWKVELSSDYTLLELELDRFLNLQRNEDFPGKSALLAEQQQGPRKRLVSLRVEAGEADAPNMSTVCLGDEVVGEVSSGGFGHRVGHSIALALVRSDLAKAGTTLEVDIYGERCAAVVQANLSIWDPENQRLRA